MLTNQSEAAEVTVGVVCLLSVKIRVIVCVGLWCRRHVLPQQLYNSTTSCELERTHVYNSPVLAAECGQFLTKVTWVISAKNNAANVNNTTANVCMHANVCMQMLSDFVIVYQYIVCANIV